MIRSGWLLEGRVSDRAFRESEVEWDTKERGNGRFAIDYYWPISLSSGR